MVGRERAESARGIPDRHRRRAGARCHVDHLDAALDGRRSERGHMVEEHRLEVILGDAGGLARADHGTLRFRGVADSDPRPFGGAGSGRRLEHCHLDLVGAVADPVLEPPRTHQFHRVQAQDRGARHRRTRSPSVDEQDVHFGPGKGDGGGEAGRSGPHDHHVVLAHPRTFHQTGCLSSVIMSFKGRRVN
jgi:hypothetical protein